MFDKRLMQMCPESRKYIAGNIILQFLELCCNALMIITVSVSVQKLYEHVWGLNDFVFPFVIISATVLLRFFTTRYAVRMSYLASRTVKRVMREKIYSKLLRLGTSYREHVTTAELVQESVEGVEQLESYFGQYVPQFFYAFMAPAALFFLFGFGGSWKVATVLLICVPLIPAAIIMVQKIAKKILARYWGQYTRLGSTFLENLQGMTTLKTYQADEYKNIEMNRESEHFRKVTMAVLTMQLNSVTIMDFVAYGGTALGILLAVKAFANGELGLANVIFMILFSADFFLPMRRLGSYFHVAMNGMAASDKIFRFLQEDEPAERTGRINGLDIELKNVHFSYDKDREILHGIELSVPQGGFIGIAGESGSGKSTIASLIVARNTADSGEITIGGKDIRTVNEENLMKNITYVGTGSAFFKGTVRENLLPAAPDAADEDLWKVLSDCALADDFKCGKGLDTVLQENAGNLSGGQKQRLALARAILHDSPVYIFDEATSNIDIESEETILKQIHRIARDKTVIMISHRLANVADADRIFVMENGRVCESGTHDELLADEGVYARLWKTQSALENYGREAYSNAETE
ncbi:MAG: ABC transporter ATP-binding protein/permease [Erysipelotrichaceae bacterium]|nr:ABC transporter ATP-binding protein/permease [Erysipelotrichaceae bacterium]